MILAALWCLVGLTAGLLASRVVWFLIVQDLELKLMAKFDDVKAAVADVSAAVDAAGVRVAAAIEAAGAGAISEAQADELVSDLGAVKAKVDAVAA